MRWLVVGYEIVCRAPARVALATDERQRLLISVAHDETGGRFLDRPRPRKATIHGARFTTADSTRLASRWRSAKLTAAQQRQQRH
jgi:hypothetical protein